MFEYHIKDLVLLRHKHWRDLETIPATWLLTMSSPNPREHRLQPDPNPEIRLPSNKSITGPAGALRKPFVRGPRRPNSWRHPGGTVSETEELSESETDKDHTPQDGRSSSRANESKLQAYEVAGKRDFLQKEDRQYSYSYVFHLTPSGAYLMIYWKLSCWKVRDLVRHEKTGKKCSNFTHLLRCYWGMNVVGLVKLSQSYFVNGISSWNLCHVIKSSIHFMDSTRLKRLQVLDTKNFYFQ